MSVKSSLSRQRTVHQIGPMKLQRRTISSCGAKKAKAKEKLGRFWKQTEVCLYDAKHAENMLRDDVEPSYTSVRYCDSILQMS